MSAALAQQAPLLVVVWLLAHTLHLPSSVCPGTTHAATHARSSPCTRRAARESAVLQQHPMRQRPVRRRPVLLGGAQGQWRGLHQPGAVLQQPVLRQRHMCVWGPACALIMAPDAHVCSTAVQCVFVVVPTPAPLTPHPPLPPPPPPPTQAAGPLLATSAQRTRIAATAPAATTGCASRRGHQVRTTTRGRSRQRACCMQGVLVV
jgi:hypothetical protein